MSEFDSKALILARQVMALTRQTHIGGDVQLLAKIQCLFVEAMEYAAPQSFGNSEQLKSPDIPLCYQRLLRHAHGMTMGCDWNNGTIAGYHREKLCQAVKDCLSSSPGKEG